MNPVEDLQQQLKRNRIREQMMQQGMETSGEISSLRELVKQLSEGGPGTLLRWFAAMGEVALDDKEIERRDNIGRAQRDFNVGWDHLRPLPSPPPERKNFGDFRARLRHPQVAEASDAVRLWRLGGGPAILTLAGPPGTGKSHLAIAAAHELIDAKRPVCYREEIALVGELQQLIRADKVEPGIREVCEVPWLVLDDLGTAALGDWGRAVMDRIIHARWLNAHFARTLVTTNLVGEDLPARIASRLGDVRVGQVIVVRAPDYRRHPG
ncbi:MAG: ATP-binding protein [Chloroflexota bacterium]